MSRFGVAGLLFVLAGVFAPATQAADLHVGYYYPQPQTREVYVTEVPMAADATETSRAGFVIGLAAQQLNQKHAPGYHMFAKGDQLEKLIIISTEEGRYNTLFRFRALLASLTSMARATPLFSQSAEPYELNFLDFCKLMGFTQVTVSDGDTLAHQIKIE